MQIRSAKSELQLCGAGCDDSVALLSLEGEYSFHLNRLLELHMGETLEPGRGERGGREREREREGERGKRGEGETG